MPGAAKLDVVCIGRLQRIVKETGCEVVLSSTWRASFKSQDGHWPILKYAIRPVQIFERTPLRDFSTARHLEIEEWLAANPDVSMYVILDDDSDANIEGHFVQTCFEDGGLTEELADRAIEMLGRIAA